MPEVCPHIINLCFMLGLLFGENCMVRKVTKIISSQNFSLSFSNRCLLPDVLLSYFSEFPGQILISVLSGYYLSKIPCVSFHFTLYCKASLYLYVYRPYSVEREDDADRWIASDMEGDGRGLLQGELHEDLKRAA